jgi:hypothetical protein
MPLMRFGKADPGRFLSNRRIAMAKVRLSIEVSKELAALLDSLAELEDTTKTEIVRRALSVMKAYRDQASVGRNHLGFTADPTKLDAELVGILSAAENSGTSSARSDRVK